MAALLAAAAACASQGAPPGGPPDPKPPEVVRITPDTGAVNVTPPRVVFRFDEVVSERPQGAATLDALFLVSPRDGEPDVSWKRDAITVRPHHGFRKNTVYVVTMLPGLTDLRGNVRKSGATAIFSTGATIPDTHLDGIVFDWPSGRPAPRSYVQAIARPDSVLYVGVGDTTGRFTLSHLPPGRYTVQALLDANNNRVIDPRELWDSTTVTLGDSGRVELLAFVHDTVGPRINQVNVRDSVTLRVAFDKPVDVTQRIERTLFTLRRADSTAVPIVEARSSAEWDQAELARARTRDDSLRAADTSSVGGPIRNPRAGGVSRADSARRASADTAFGRVRTPGVTRPDTARHRSGAADTVKRAEEPKPSRPAPTSEAVIRVGAPLVPGTAYRLQATNVRGLLGNARTSERVFSLPKAPTLATDSLGAAPTRPAAGNRPVPPDSARRALPPVRPPA
jgi:hypothetical protein